MCRQVKGPDYSHVDIQLNLYARVSSCSALLRKLEDGGERLPSADSRLGLVGLFLHDFHDHATGSGAALGGGVDGDRLLRGTCVLFSMNVDPGRRTHDDTC